MQPGVQLLGHVIDARVVHTDEEKVQKMRDAQPRCNAKQLKTFLGLASYYRQFIK